MATPKTGRPRGRPKGSTGGGRPPKSLADDQWRYLYAAAAEAIDRHSRLVDGLSEMRICLLATLFMFGRPVRAGESIMDDAPIITARKLSEARGGPLIGIVHESWDKPDVRAALQNKPRKRAEFLGKEPWDRAPSHVRSGVTRQNAHREHAALLANETWFKRNAFRREAKNLRDRLRYLSEPTNANWRHFSGLKTIVRMVLDEPERVERAASIAAEIGESDYFERTVRPLMANRASSRHLGFGLPPFDLPELVWLIFPAEPPSEAANDNAA
jgi:hypothetical protein